MEPMALYRIPNLAKLYGWEDTNLNDDILARALDSVFKSDRATLQTEITLSMLSSYKIDTSTIHNDSTSIKFFGEYKTQSHQSVKLKRGHSKDHRPDLKQLIYNLCVCEDSAVPIHFKCYDGNTTDDSLHVETWLTLRGTLGKSDFLYVADSKLCTSNNMRKIDREQGQFITIVPKTRTEVKEFFNSCYDGKVRWRPLTRYASTRKKGKFDVFQVSEGFYQLEEGFKLFWYRSSEKKKRDKESRETRIAAAIESFKTLQNSPKRPKTAKGLLSAANKVLKRFKVNQWISLDIKIEEVKEFHQDSPGKPSSDTKYIRKIKKIPHLMIDEKYDEMALSQAIDGVFPLVTNTNMSAKETLEKYKYQPRIEKRFSHMKSDYQIAPTFLKKTERIEALMFVCFLSDMFAAIVQRELQVAMKKNGVDKLYTLPEERPTKTPTWEQIQRLFAHHGRQELKGSGAPIKTFWDELTPHQKKVLELMEIPISKYSG